MRKGLKALTKHILSSALPTGTHITGRQPGHLPKPYTDKNEVSKQTAPPFIKTQSITKGGSPATYLNSADKTEVSQQTAPPF